MFKGSGSFTDVGNNVINTLLVDEAHRLNEKSGMFSNLGENQVKEIIHSSLCSVFFHLKSTCNHERHWLC